jgi:nucleotide-binding universal stress UspA family protein
MKNILLLVHDDAGQEARLQAALDVTRAVEGHLRCLDVTQIPVTYGAYCPPAGAMLVQDEVQAMLLEDESAREGDNRQRIEARLAGEGVSWDWADIAGDMAESLVAVSDLADLIVLNRKLDAFPGPDARGIAGAVIMGARRPVLAVPDALASFAIGGRAVVAWDGSAAAAAAMRASVPLLALVAEVRLLCVETDDGNDSLVDDAASYLSRYGIRPEVRRVQAGKQSPADVIPGECAQWHADWCVMGAYGHGRLREALFGGVTRRMLTDSSIPLLLSH